MAMYRVSDLISVNLNLVMMQSFTDRATSVMFSRSDVTDGDVCIVYAYMFKKKFLSQFLPSLVISDAVICVCVGRREDGLGRGERG